MIVGFVTVFPIYILSSTLVPVTVKITFAEEYIGIVAFFTTLIIGYLTAFIYEKLFKIQNKSLTNITIFTQTKEFKQLVNSDRDLIKVDRKFRKKKITELERNNAYLEFEKLEELVDQQA